MLLRQDRFHIHPILCAKIVQGERKRKELVHFLFPSRSLYYQKIVQGERKTEQTERKIKFTSIFPRCSRFYQKRKELVHFLFPSRSLYYQKIVQGERKTEQTERKIKFTSIFPRCSRFYQKRKELVHFLFPSRSLYYLTLEISGRSRISPNAIIPCVQAPPHHRPLRRVSAATPLSLACRDGAATCMPPTNLRSNDCRARHSPGYSTAANWANP